MENVPSRQVWRVTQQVRGLLIGAPSHRRTGPAAAYSVHRTAYVKPLPPWRWRGHRRLHECQLPYSRTNNQLTDRRLSGVPELVADLLGGGSVEGRVRLFFVLLCARGGG